MTHTQTMLGVVDTRTAAENILSDLKRAGYSPKDMSILMRDTRKRVHTS